MLIMKAFGHTRFSFARHAAHDLQVRPEKILSAHPRLPRDAGGDDDDVRVLQVVVVRRAHQAGVEALDRRHLLHVEGLALGHALRLRDVEQDDVAQLFLCREEGEVAADLAGANEADLSPRHSLHSVSPAPEAARFIAWRTRDFPYFFEVLDDRLAELRGADDLRVVQVAGQIRRHRAFCDGLDQRVRDELCRVLPAEVVEQHHAAEQHRRGVEILHVRVGQPVVGALEDRRLGADERVRREADLPEGRERRSPRPGRR